MSPDFEIIDPRLGRYLLGNCKVERLYTGTLWAEGPCYFADGNFLVRSDIPNDRMMRWVDGLGVEPARSISRTARSTSAPSTSRAPGCATAASSPPPSTACSTAFRLDSEGNVWTSAGEGVNCYTGQGDLLGRIRVPETVSNCTFGGSKRNRLFMTATSSLYAVFLNARGVQTP